jgi:hypothetical protein
MYQGTSPGHATPGPGRAGRRPAKTPQRAAMDVTDEASPWVEAAADSDFRAEPRSR